MLSRQYLVMDWILETWGFGFWKCHGEMVWRQVEQLFSSFFATFDDFSKWSIQNVLQNFGKSSNMLKIWPCSTCLKPVFGCFWVRENPISSTRSVTSNTCIPKIRGEVPSRTGPSYSFQDQKARAFFAGIWIIVFTI